MTKPKSQDQIMLTHQMAALWLYSIGCSSIITWSFMTYGVVSGLVSIGSAIAVPFVVAAAGRVMG